MLRYLAVAALLLGPCLNLSQAQHIRIKIDLNEFPVLSTGPAMLPPGFDGEGEFPADGDFDGESMYPGGFLPGYPGMPGDPAGKDKKAEDIPPLWIEVWLPYQKHEFFPPRQKATHTWVTHPWGESLIPADAVGFVPDEHVKKRFASLRQRGSDLHHRAGWALRYGLMDEFVETMKELEKKDPEHFSVKSFRQAYEQWQKKPERDDPSAKFVIDKVKSERYGTYVSKHGRYVLFSKMGTADTARGRAEKVRVEDRLEQLERAYQQFFFWFALRGKALPQPNYRLVAVMEPTPRAFKNQHDFFTSHPMTQDGFTSRRDNVIFLSALPAAPTFALLVKNNRLHWNNFKGIGFKGVGFKQLLKPDRRKLAVTPDYARLSTMALVEKVMQIDSERSATSHEVVRQLLIATDLLPRHLTTAEWLRYGMASFFETPSKALFESTGTPHHTNLLRFRRIMESKEEPGLVLLNVITDQYFSKAHQAFQTLPDDTQKFTQAEKNAHEQLEEAQATAWALTYYLMNHRLDDLMNYMAELKKLPQHIEYDAGVLSATFAKAFKMTDMAADNPLKINLDAVSRLGNQWYRELNVTRLDAGVETIIRNDPANKKKKQ